MNFKLNNKLIILYCDTATGKCLRNTQQVK